MKSKPKVLLIEHEESVRHALGTFLQSKGYATLQAANAARGLALIRSQLPDAIVLDVELPDSNAFDLLREIRAEYEYAPVILITHTAETDFAAKAIQHGVEGYLTKPPDESLLLILLERSLQNSNLKKQMIISAFAKESADFFQGNSGSIVKIHDLAALIAKDPLVTVLIQGETGTGKRKWARWIHDHSERTDYPFVEVNCTKISKELLESELFGYEHATNGVKTALLEITNKGTLFLNHIHEMGKAVQAKLVKVLEQKKFRRVGSVHDRTIDIRFVASTNRNLEKSVKDGHFREDLFYRLNMMPLILPPLRDQKEDILPMADFFLDQIKKPHTVPRLILTDEAKDILRNYSWPGNIRELRILLERACMLSKNHILDATLFPIHQRVTVNEADSTVPLQPLREVELKYIKYVLARVNNNYRKAAEILGVNRNTVYNRLRDHRTGH